MDGSKLNLQSLYTNLEVALKDDKGLLDKLKNPDMTLSNKDINNIAKKIVIKQDSDGKVIIEKKTDIGWWEGLKRAFTRSGLAKPGDMLYSNKSTKAQTQAESTISLIRSIASNQSIITGQDNEAQMNKLQNVINKVINKIGMGEGIDFSTRAAGAQSPPTKAPEDAVKVEGVVVKAEEAEDVVKAKPAIRVAKDLTQPAIALEKALEAKGKISANLELLTETLANEKLAPESLKEIASNIKSDIAVIREESLLAKDSEADDSVKIAGQIFELSRYANETAKKAENIDNLSDILNAFEGCKGDENSLQREVYDSVRKDLLENINNKEFDKTLDKANTLINANKDDDKKALRQLLLYELEYVVEAPIDSKISDQDLVTMILENINDCDEENQKTELISLANKILPKKLQINNQIIEQKPSELERQVGSNEHPNLEKLQRLMQVVSGREEQTALGFQSPEQMFNSIEPTTQEEHELHQKIGTLLKQNESKKPAQIEQEAVRAVKQKSALPPPPPLLSKAQGTVQQKPAGKPLPSEDHPQTASSSTSPKIEQVFVPAPAQKQSEAKPKEARAGEPLDDSSAQPEVATPVELSQQEAPLAPAAPKAPTPPPAPTPPAAPAAPPAPAAPKVTEGATVVRTQTFSPEHVKGHKLKKSTPQTDDAKQSKAAPGPGLMRSVTLDPSRIPGKEKPKGSDADDADWS